MALRIGEVVGEYEVMGLLGAGGMGEVYKVRHVISQRLEALKLLHDRDLGSPNSLDRFSREIRVLARLQHPNIAVLHTAFRFRDQLAMVMEYAEGATLTQKLRPPGITLTEGLFYISQVLSALTYAHSQGVVHRDVKPANIIIGPGVLKLVDFGVATTGLDSRLTASGQVVGSIHYMAPEQITGSEVDARSDIYSVGVTLYEVITGKLPFEGENYYALMTGHLSEAPVPPSEIKPMVPPRLSTAVMKALSKVPAERFQCADEFLAEINAVQACCSETMETMITMVLPAVRPSDGVRGERGSSGHSTPRPGSSGDGIGHGSAILAEEPALIDEVGRELATYIGPIARIIVKRAAKRCTTVNDLFTAVAPEIDSIQDRERFLAAKRRYLRAS